MCLPMPPSWFSPKKVLFTKIYSSLAEGESVLSQLSPRFVATGSGTIFFKASMPGGLS